MALHTRLVPLYDGKTLLPPDEVVEYYGPENWKFRPIDIAAREKWEREFANPERVEQARRGFDRREQFIDGEKHDALIAMHHNNVVGKRKLGSGTSHLSNGAKL